MHPLNGSLLGPYVPVRANAVLWSRIGTLMHRLAAGPCSTGGLLFPSRCPSGTILLTPYSMVWDWRVLIAGSMLFYWLQLLYPYYSLLLFFPFSSFCWYCRAGVFELIGCISHSPNLALPSFFTTTNNNNIGPQPSCQNLDLDRPDIAMNYNYLDSNNYCTHEWTVRPCHEQ